MQVVGGPSSETKAVLPGLHVSRCKLSRGRLTLDRGAIVAVVSRRASLLPAGIIGVSGDFDSGDPVDLATADGTVVARGLVGYDAADLPSLLGRKTGELPTEFRRAVVHRDDLALL